MKFKNFNCQKNSSRIEYFEEGNFFMFSKFLFATRGEQNQQRLHGYICCAPMAMLNKCTEFMIKEKNVK